ncbi:MAG: hypothetical protein R2713_02850 [Ilumatobacteraceae bacterium]
MSPPPELGFEAAMRWFLHDLVRQMSDPKWNRMMPALLALKAYEATLADVERHMDEMQGHVSTELFARGVREGCSTRATTSSDRSRCSSARSCSRWITGETPLTTDLADESLRCFMAGLHR